jgi:hypothetical protein
VNGKRLGGWWRLWIVIALVWIGSVAAFAYAMWPSGSRASDHPAFHYQLEPKQREMLAEEGDTSGLGVRMPNGTTLWFRPGVSETEAAPVARSYDAITLRAQEETQRSFTVIALTVAVVPPLLLAVLGLAVAWVRSGFKNA